MSESGHFLFYNRDGTTNYFCKLYTTAEECGANYLVVFAADGIPYYAPLGEPNNPGASHLRVCNATGSIKSVLVDTMERYGYTGGPISYTVPLEKTSLSFKMWGAGGYGSGKGIGGAGACIVGSIPVTPGEVLTFKIGQAGRCDNSYYGGSGGGGTYILRGTTLIAVAGGGGGCGTFGTDWSILDSKGGGGGGSGNAQAGNLAITGCCGGGASQTAGGAGGVDCGTGRSAGVAGALGLGGSYGNGGTRAFPDGGGYMGGGGGFYGGGSGAWYNNSSSYWGGPGGGGSSLVPAGCTGYAANYEIPGNSSDSSRGVVGSQNCDGVILIL